jgi:streptolysin S family bacteriocin protoxin
LESLVSDLNNNRSPTNDQPGDCCCCSTIRDTNVFLDLVPAPG